MFRTLDENRSYCKQANTLLEQMPVAILRFISLAIWNYCSCGQNFSIISLRQLIMGTKSTELCFGLVNCHFKTASDIISLALYNSSYAVVPLYKLTIF